MKTQCFPVVIDLHVISYCLNKTSGHVRFNDMLLTVGLYDK